VWPGPRRRRLPDGTVEEYSAAMGWSLIVPAYPRPRTIDLSADAPGWLRPLLPGSAGRAVPDQE
jgi:hypothetical protein